MSEMAKAAPIAYPHLIDNRYQVIKLLGKGGMAVVYQVSDLTTGKEVALKQLLVRENETRTQEVTELFEHEYHILAQLAHPRIIEVYDFGRDPLAPYYTMELLDGGDIRELAPMPWKRACSVFIDVCSALSLIHSRRQLHCDLSPRNVRCTRDSKAKIIDFGAMTPMGPCKRLIGTPSCTPPEVVGLQTIDARADLYTMGATMYYALTGRFAYRASSFRDLLDAWRSKPRAPSSIVEDIPKELDELVLSLINLDMMARPVNAAEVMEKLSATAGIEIDNALLGTQAYLSKPMFVGRDEHIVLVRKQMVQALVGVGGAFFIEGAPGAGRSSFLDACVLEGRVVGATVLRADASDSYVGAWGVIKTLAMQLLDALPEVALEAAKPRVAVLGQILPDLVDRLENAKRRGIESVLPGVRTTASENARKPFERSAQVWARGYSSRPKAPPDAGQSGPAPGTLDPKELRPRILTALGDWWLEIARQRCMVVAIDDIHRVDEPSAACIALLSQRLSSSMQLLAVTAETDAPSVSPIAVKLLKQSAAKINLAQLPLAHTEKLMRSIFGEAANLTRLASTLQAITTGNPRAVMQLLQHMLDMGLIRYQSGSWTLPVTIHEADLPQSFNEAMEAKARTLGPEARQLAQTMALNPDQRFSYDECKLLTGHSDAGRLIQNLDHLIAAEILATDGLNYWIIHPGWAPVLRQSIDEPDRHRLHLRMAELFEKRGNDPFRDGQHLLRGGQQQRALDVFIEFSKSSRALTDRDPGAFSDLIQALPKDWLDTYREAIDICEKAGRPRQSIYALRSRLSGLISVVGTDDNDNITQVLKQICADSGLTIYHELGDSVEPEGRLGRAFELAQQRYDSSPETEKVFSPFEAVPALAKAMIEAVGGLSNSYDYAFWMTLPSLTPFMTLSPALEVVDKFVQAIGYRISSRCDQTRQAYREILERTGQPDHAGLQDTHYIYMRLGVMRGLGMMEAAMGISSALDWARAIETDPLHRVYSVRIQMIYHTWQGSTIEAEECKKRIEVLQTKNSPVQWFEGSHLGQEVLAYALSDDLIGVKQATDGIETMARNFANWRTTLQYARAEHHRIRGDLRNALELLHDALKHTAPGRNHDWPYIASGYLRTLNALGEYPRSEVEGRQLVEAAEDQSLGFVASFLKMPLAEAEARQAHAADAVATVDSVIKVLETLGTTGLSRGLAYETRARVAAILDDVEGFDSNAKRCAEQYKAGENPALTSKYQKLMREVRGAQYGVSDNLALTSDSTQLEAVTTPAQIAALLESCQDAAERAGRVLDILIKLSNSEGGFLYTFKAQGLELSAKYSQIAPPPEMDGLIRTRLNREIEEANTDMDETAAASSMDTPDWAMQMGDKYRSVLLGHYAPRGFAITGMVVFSVDSKKPYRFPGKTVELVSRSLLDFGDVAPVFVDE